MRWMAVFLVACGGSSAVSAPSRAPEESLEARKARLSAEAAQMDTVSDPVGEGSWGVPPPRREGPLEDHPACPLKRAKLAELQEKLAESEAADAEYVRTRCSGTLKREVWTTPAGGRAPERAWICDGHLVDVPESVKTQWIATKIGDVNDWLMTHCIKK